MGKPQTPKLTEIAERINAHLKRFEADPDINHRDGRPGGLQPYYKANARRTGRFVRVTYVSFQGHPTLTRDEALAYLAWLDAGHVGRHWKQQREAEGQR